MNQKIKTRWLVALRSGAYKQARGNLKNEDGYCCLGVLCDVMGYRFVKIPYEGTYRVETKDDDVFHTSVLPPEIVELAELDSYNPVVTLDDELYTLTILNDSKFDFLKIADIIEEQL